MRSTSYTVFLRHYPGIAVTPEGEGYMYSKSLLKGS